MTDESLLTNPGKPARPSPSDNHPPGEVAATGERLRAIIERLPDGIVIVDPTGTIRFANPAAESLFNRSAVDLIGTLFGFPVLVGDTTEIDVVQRGGGEVVYAELLVVDTEWEGEVVKLVSLRDITDRKHVEERSRQLAAEREARLEAEAASRAKSEFLAIMSHELRTPLNAVLGYSELMELGLSGPMTDGMREQVGRIRSSAKHLLALVNDILDLAKVEAGRLVVNSAAGSAEVEIASAISLIQPQATANGLEVKVETRGDTPAVFVGDAERVRQILVNLLSNAVKFTPPGGTITTESGTAQSPGGETRLQGRRVYAFISVADTGGGIAENKLAGIFEPFVQADAGTTRAREGSGLGLTISRRLARLMGGDLTVRSEVARGSTFTLWLPAPGRSGDDAPADKESAGAPREKDTPENSGDEGLVADVDAAPPVERGVAGLAEVGAALLSTLVPTLAAIVSRIRCDPSLAMTAGLRDSEVMDHLPTFLADVAGALVTMEESGGSRSRLLSDAVEIQRLISERHGAQRTRLGWVESQFRREFMIVREELERVVSTHFGPLRGSEAAEAVGVINRFLDHSEYFAVRSHDAIAIGDRRRVESA